MKWLIRNRETVIPAFVAIALALLLTILVRLDILTTSKLAANKDALSALSSSVSMVVLLIGSVFSYYRFFRGRTFFARADININVTVIDTNADKTIHFVVVEIKNIGTLPIWNPIPIVDVTTLGATAHKSERWDRWTDGTINEERKLFTVVDSGECASFINKHEVPKDAWAVGYIAYVTAESGITWKKAIAVQNVPEKKIAKYGTD